MSRASDCSASCLEEMPEPANPDTDEEEVFATKAALYRFCSEKQQWDTRANGVLKILKNNETGVHRVIMRQALTYLVRMNHQIPYLGTISSFQKSDCQLKWTAFDYADQDEVRELFAVKFAEPTISNAFKAAFEAGQAANKAIYDK